MRYNYTWFCFPEIQKLDLKLDLNFDAINTFCKLDSTNNTLIMKLIFCSDISVYQITICFSTLRLFWWHYQRITFCLIDVWQKLELCGNGPIFVPEEDFVREFSYYEDRPQIQCPRSAGSWIHLGRAISNCCVCTFKFSTEKCDVLLLFKLSTKI